MSGVEERSDGVYSGVMFVSLSHNSLSGLSNQPSLLTDRKAEKLTA